jgi:hypothetical protein
MVLPSIQNVVGICKQINFHRPVSYVSVGSTILNYSSMQTASSKLYKESSVISGTGFNTRDIDITTIGGCSEYFQGISRFQYDSDITMIGGCREYFLGISRFQYERY